MKGLKEKFLNPDKDYRSAPFWSWNDKLDPEELARQVRDMKSVGIGGFFMHSREGLETPYLSKEWMSCIRRTVETAKEIGMNAWLYDEDRWPSGFAGGLVAKAIGDEGRAKILTLEIVKGELDPIESLVSFVAILDGSSIVKLKRTTEKTTLEDNEVGLIFRREICPKVDWFNGDTYSDNLNPKSVKTFIETTYEAYFKEFGDEFGKTISGIFTDEPNIFAWRVAKRGLPWTDIFPEFFRDRRGYDIIENLPYLFLDGERSYKIRYDYWRTITELFVNAYSKQIGEWCKEHNLLFTGHYLYENEFPRAILTSGAIMPHYVYQGVPGIDILTESIRETLTVKQCSSVANQFDKKRVISELYGCTGWEFTFEGQKWVGDWQYALGVNLRCQHLALYTLRGCRKRDYPPSFNYNTTWWKYNRVVEDYFARLSLILSEGEAVRDILLIHPIESAWMLFNGVNFEEVSKIGEEFQGIADTLLAIHRDFDLGDESIIEEYGKVVDGRFIVNKASYKFLVLPPMKTIRRKTVELIKEFLDCGGKVVAIKPTPDKIFAQEENLSWLFNHPNMFVLDNKRDLGKVLDKVLEPRISIQEIPGEEAGNFIYMERDIEGNKVFFVVNTDRSNSHTVEISIHSNGKVEEWNPLTGDIREIYTEQEENLTRIRADFGPAESKVYVVDAKSKPTLNSPRKLQYKKSLYIGPVLKFKRSDPNILVLDFCQYRFKGEKWSDILPVWKAQLEIRRRLGMRDIHINGIEQRWRWVYQPHPNDNTPIEFRFIFNVRDIPKTPISLVIENAEDFEISFNGQSICNKPRGWYLDRSFDKVELPTPKIGENELILFCLYKNRMEVEDCYIIGDFGVDVLTREIIEEPDKLHFGDWCLQGYPHYAGSISYIDEVELNLESNEKVFLKLGNHSAITTAVWINGRLAGHIPWKCADGLDITSFVTKGRNLIEIEVVGSPRNMLGPLHQKSGKRPWTDSRSFRTEGDEFTPDYVLMPLGLFDQVRLEIFAE
ncbi:MAG: glycosyl hydrolase [bacterium]